MSIYGEGRRAEAAINSVRSHYPDAPMIAVSDGDSDPCYQELAKKYAVRLIYGVQLKLPGMGHLYLRRLFDASLEYEFDHAIKLDPNSRMLRAFGYLLDADIQGTIVGLLPGMRHVQGGCQIMTAGAMRRLLAAPLLDPSRPHWPIESIHYPYVRLRIRRYERLTGTGNIDLLLAAAGRQAGLQMADLPEVLSLWRRIPPAGDFAVIHPAPPIDTADSALC